MKIPNLGTLTPLPIRRFRFMYNPREFQIRRIYSSLKTPSALNILILCQNYFDWERDASSSSILEEAFDALEATLRLMNKISFRKRY